MLGVTETQCIKIQDGIKPHLSSDEGSNLLRNSASLDKKFSQELNALLNDDDDMAEDSKFGSLVGKIDSPIDSPRDYGDRQLGTDFSVEMPDYSPDFNSESERIGEERSGKDARYCGR